MQINSDDLAQAAPCKGRFFEHLLFGLNAAGAIWIVVLMVLINADILLRWLLNAPIPGVAEFVGLSITGIVFLQLAHSLHQGRFIRSDATGALLERHPALARVLNVLFSLTGATLFGALAFVSWPSFQAAWRDNLYVGAVGTITFPTWPVLLIIVIGSVATALQYLWFAASALLQSAYSATLSKD